MKNFSKSAVRKLVLSFLFVLFGFGIQGAFAQNSTSPDTVCAGATGRPYFVTNTPGSTYIWKIAGGTKASGGTSNSITVDWSTTTGTDTLKVVEISANGCPGDTVKLAVYRMPLPTASITGSDSICYKGSSSFTVNLTGVGPWDFTWSDGTNNYDVKGATTNQVVIPVTNMTTTTTYTLVSVKTSRKACAGSVSGSAKVKVFPKPTTSAIFHN